MERLEFRVPAQLEDLELAREGAVSVRNASREVSAVAVDEAASCVAEDPRTFVEPDVLDVFYSAVRYVRDGGERGALVRFATVGVSCAAQVLGLGGDPGARVGVRWAAAVAACSGGGFSGPAVARGGVASGRRTSARVCGCGVPFGGGGSAR